MRGAEDHATSDTNPRDGSRPQRRRPRSSVVGDRAKGKRIMTEAAGGGRAEIERTLVQRSMEDEDFRKRLLDDLKAAVEQELGTRLPEGVQVRAGKETADTIYLVLPFSSPVGGEGGELSDEALESVAGGDDVIIVQQTARLC